MANRLPLITNKERKRIEELPIGDYLDLSQSGIVSATSIQSETFYGNLVGIALSAVSLTSAENISGGIIARSRLAGTYDINITGTVSALDRAENILDGTLNPARLAGTYNINIAGTASTAFVNNTNQNLRYYPTFVASNGNQTLNIDTDRSLSYNPSTKRLGINTDNPSTTLEVVGNTKLNGTLNVGTILGTGAVYSGVITAFAIDAPFNGTISNAAFAGYATTAGIATVAQGLSGSPSISITNLNTSGISTLGSVQISNLGIGATPNSNWRLTTNGGTTQNVSTVTAVSGIYTLDVTSGNQFLTSATIAGATTINLSNLNNIPSGYVWQGVITFQYTSGVISWFTGNSGYTVNWNGVGATAMVPTVGKIEKVVIEVVGGGSVIRVSPLGGGSGTVLTSRTVSSTTPSTLNLATVDFTMSLGKVSKLLQITLSHPSWVRFYRSSSQRSADTRSGPGGTLQGVIDLGDAKPYSESVTLGLNQIIDQNPIPTLRGDSDGLVYVRLVNQSGSTQSITLSTLTLRLEE